MKALITLSQKDTDRYGLMLIMGFSNYLALYHEDKKRFAPHTNAQSYYLRQVWAIFAEFFKNNLKLIKNMSAPINL